MSEETQHESRISILSRITGNSIGHLEWGFGFAREFQADTNNVREIISVLEASSSYRFADETFWEEAIEEWLEDKHGVDIEAMY